MPPSACCARCRQLRENSAASMTSRESKRLWLSLRMHSFRRGHRDRQKMVESGTHGKSEEGGMSRARVAIGLLHYPIYDRSKKVVATNITNLDVHDIARACRV